MFEYGLKKIHDVMNYPSLFSTDQEYMNELCCLPRIELDTEPLYVLAVQSRVLFTPKLRYMKKYLENEVNRYINAATNIIGEDGSEQVTKFVLKKARETTKTLISEVRRQLETFDSDGSHWGNASNEKPDFNISHIVPMEYVVFLHCAMAEITRCWLEIQDRYAYLIGEEALYDVSLIYTTFLKATPDKAFEVKRSEKYDEESKKFKKSRSDCSFLYDNEEYFAIAIQEFTNKLKRHHLIDNSVDVKNMESLFSGHPCRITIQWLGDNHILTSIIKGLCPDDKPTITTWPAGTSKWEVVSKRFLDKNGEPMPNIRQESKRKKTESVVEEIIEALTGYL